MVEGTIDQEIFGRLQQATAGNAEVMAELCRDYISEARLTLNQLRSALSDGNAAQFRERAHYLKGSSMMIGAKHLSRCCGALEQMGRDSDLQLAEAELQRAAEALKSVETHFMETLGPSALPDVKPAA